MHLELLARAPLVVQLHMLTVVPAFLLGTWLMFASRKGSPVHRRLGYAYLVLMSLTAIDAIFVQELNPGHWTWVHLFVPLTAWGVFAALWRVRRGDIAGHRKAMQGLYFGGLLIAGGFTFFPGRLLYRVFFGN